MADPSPPQQPSPQPSSSASYSEPSYAKHSEPTTSGSATPAAGTVGGKKFSDYPWYMPSVERHLFPETRRFLEGYSGIQPEELVQHVNKIRDLAFSIRAYPCTGLGLFISHYLPRSPAYPTILSTVRNGGIFLDIGCHLGADSRRLIFDIDPESNKTDETTTKSLSSQLYGVDIVSHWDVGFELFRDRDRFKSSFIEADFLDGGNVELKRLQGKVDVVHVSAVLHQWDWEAQVRAAKRIVEFSKPPGEGIGGTVVVGHQIGNAKAKEVALPATKGAVVWRHDPESWKRMWEVVGRETGTTWEVEMVGLLKWKDLGWYEGQYTQGWMEEDVRVLEWVVRRTE